MSGERLTDRQNGGLEKRTWILVAVICAILLGVSAITVPWDTLIVSVVLYIVVPLVIAQVWRKALLSRGQAVFEVAPENWSS